MMALRASAFTGTAVAAKAAVRTRATARVVRVQARESAWFPGNTAPAHLDGSLPGDFGFDPLRLGSKPEDLRWYVEAELQNGRWAMLACAGILAQEILNPSVFFYEAAVKATLPFDILGLVAVQFLLMHFVELRRIQDWKKPGSVDQDPLFPGNKLPPHAVGYPGGIFDPLGFGKSDLKTAQVKEIKNARLAMLGFVGMVMSAQVTGKGPLANLADHLASPFSTSIMAKSVVLPGTGRIAPVCAIPEVTSFRGIDIPTPCFLEAFWP